MAFDRGSNALVKRMAKNTGEKDKNDNNNNDDNDNDCGIFMATVSTTAVMKIT